MMQDDLVTARTMGTPQVGPLSPLLSNILLTDLDRELKLRELALCRSADDCNVYVRSQAAAALAVAAAVEAPGAPGAALGGISGRRA